MKHSFVTQAPAQWIGVTLTTSIKDGAKDIGPFLERHYVGAYPTVTTTIKLEEEASGPFLQRHHEDNTLAKIPNKVNPNRSFSGYTDYTRPVTFENSYLYILGSFVTTLDVVPEGMVGGHVPETKYAVFTLKGPADVVVPEFWQELWATEHDFERAFSFDYELYDSATDDIKVYISIV